MIPSSIASALNTARTRNRKLINSVETLHVTSLRVKIIQNLHSIALAPPLTTDH
jgi:hypothetical protein